MKTQSNHRGVTRRLSGNRIVLLGGIAVLATAWILDGTPDHTIVKAEPTASVASRPSLPVAVNDRVLKWMDRFRTDQRVSFERYLAREGMYAGLIEAKLRERDMPEELLYLAMIESGFSSSATSRVSAVGVWQFMSPTALQYGLRVDDWVDERRDPVRATDAALDYLQWLHEHYDSWYLAAAAYNAGPGRVDRVLRRYADGRRGDEAIYWEIIDHLPRETREYVPKVLAAVKLSREAERYGFRVVRDNPYMYDRVWVPAGTSLVTVANDLEVSLELMRDLNPHLIRGLTPPGSTYGLRVPVGTTGQVVASIGERGRLADG